MGYTIEELLEHHDRLLNSTTLHVALSELAELRRCKTAMDWIETTAQGEWPSVGVSLGGLDQNSGHVVRIWGSGASVGTLAEAIEQAKEASGG